MSEQRCSAAEQIAACQEIAMQHTNGAGNSSTKIQAFGRIENLVEVELHPDQTRHRNAV